MKRIAIWSVVGIITLGATGCSTNLTSSDWGFNPPGSAVAEFDNKPRVEPVSQTNKQETSERQQALDAAYQMLHEANAQGYGTSKADMYTFLRHHDWFSHDAAQYAVDNMSTNWNNQAVISAKSYLGLGIAGGVTRAELIDYLVNGFRFTTSEANYAADQLKSQLRSSAPTPTPSATSVPANPTMTPGPSTSTPNDSPSSIPTYY